MDSFYGAPRQPPAPPKINPIERIPVVPEVSVIENAFFPRFCDNNANIRPSNENQYKDSSIYKKHVRFKSPFAEPSFGKENVPETIKTAPDLNGKTFKQIYMANVPDRHLDLSFLEPPRQENKNFDAISPLKENSSIETPSLCNTQSYKEFARLRSLQNASHSPKNPTPRYYDSRTYNENLKFSEMYQKPKPTLHNLSKSNEICTQTEPEKCTEVVSSNDEPTIKDLFHIIQQQNEQIMLLQRQVNNLKTSIRQPEIDSVPLERVDLTNSPNKKGLFSFDVKATSFEFSFRPQHKFRKNEFLEPKIQEIIECETPTVNQTNSLHLDESIDVKDSYVSNVPSIAIEMDDYHDSDDDEEPEIGLTFYKDLMKQVNNVLKKARKQSDCQMAPNLNGQAMKAVKQATLQHLENIGVNLSPIQESSEVTRRSDLDVENCNESEISCAVQQLLMKYLPADRLAKVVNKPREFAKPKDVKLKNSEFSFATLQYMKKYNLIETRNEREKMIPETSPKILDVTALKMQPKLL